MSSIINKEGNDTISYSFFEVWFDFCISRLFLFLVFIPGDSLLVFVFLYTVTLSVLVAISTSL